ncbi:uncharacterized protein Z519_04542 [Cladophialophora bantiana CBS 173.52]|uniref:Protein kinase domain-containing protein n=1 Tax=Cladophialophora bantiana (strain ATCC 10958 / CBS 173.52 / CDC B-1940 / NIH 8579) TaxID=1442370 RepID=A0A0D2EXE2_CLAB1|nr:uncharacterized protein Z519_04542 [Cladophialophora bantiana CBS 173.52]KIW94566.1 hypothetical protein Z519_04542 [Cladophialophora bantiana CBS 173.52]
MDPISFAVTTASLASVLQTCLHGYRALNVALTSSDCSLTLSVRFRLEECRLYLWGRNWGLVQQLQDITSFKEGKGVSSAQPGSSTTAKQPYLTQSLDDIDAILEIPGLRGLVMEILGRIHDILEKWQKKMPKYATSTPAKPPDVPVSIVEAGQRQKSQIKDTSKSTSFVTKLRFAIKDKGVLEELLSNLTGFNDGLENLLPRIEKESLGRGLAGEFLSTINEDGPSKLQAVPSVTDKENKEEAKTARILSLRERNQTEKNESASSPEKSRRYGYGEDYDNNEGEDDEEELNELGLQSKAAFSSDPLRTRTSSWEIPLTDFQHLGELELDYHHAQTKKADFRGPENYVPLPRSCCLYQPTAPATDAADDSLTATPPKELPEGINKATPRDTAEDFSQGPASKGNHTASQKPLATTSSETTLVPPQTTENNTQSSPIVVLIEWRLQAAETSRSQLSKEELSARREHVVSLLHRTAVADEDFRVLDCLGYTLSAGYTPDGKRMPLVGFVYRYPSTATTNILPITLRTLLDEAYNSDNGATPSLEKRMQLAQSLAIALYQLQCAGWIHRKLSSYNILFFRNRTTGELDISRPFVSGWQYSRPDDQKYQPQSEYSGRGIGDLDMYVHPARLVSRSSKIPFPRFRRSYDIYSLGVVLLEIAFWEPIFVLGSEEDREQMKDFGPSDSGRRSRDWRNRYIEVTKREMAAEMGSTYRDVVLKCLQGLAMGLDEDFGQWSDIVTGFEEPGLEKDFFWEVVRPLGRLRVI